MVNSERTPPCGVSAWARAMRPIFFGRRLATRRSRKASRARAGDLELGEAGEVQQADALAHGAAFLAHGLEELVRRKLYLSFCLRLRGANQFGRSQPYFWPNTAPSAFMRS